jgi:phosphoribosylaminoimidazole-succinocarboxamide synthase
VTAALFESTIASLPLLGRGKVRDIYAIGTDRLLIVTSDRISAFDVILPDPVPGKGKVLTRLASFWFSKLAAIVPNQLTGIDPETVVAASEREQVRGRALVVKRLRPLPIEAVVRGYLIGSGWKDYQASGSVCGIPLPAGLRLASRLPQPIFTPATKAAIGDHDENISFARAQADCAAVLADLAGGQWQERRGGRHAGARRRHRTVHCCRRACRCARHHHRRHQVRVRPRRCRYAAPDR